MVLVDAPLILAMLFFLFLPISDRRTDVAPVQLAGIVTAR